MQKLTTLFLISLMVINTTISVKLSVFENGLLPHNSLHTQLIQMLRKLKEDGTVLAFNDIIKSLKEMITQLIGEQRKHEEISKSMMSKCLEEDAFRKKEIIDAKDALDRSLVAKEKCQLSLSASQKDLPELENALELYFNQLTEVVMQRDEQHKLYLTKHESFNEAIIFLKQFLEVVKDSKPEEIPKLNLLQKTETLIRVSSKFNKLAKATPILIALSQIQQEDYTLNDYSIKKSHHFVSLEDGLKMLIKIMSADQDLATKREEELQAAFEQLKIKLEKYIIKIQNAITKTEEQINKMTLCVMNEEKITKEAQAKFDRNTELKETAHNMCESFAQEYIKATSDREENIATVQAILEICEIRFKDIPQDFKDYLETVRNGWKAYINSTEFKSYEAYVRANRWKRQKQYHQKEDIEE